MKFYTYILFSKRIDKYYIGQTNHLENRIERHNKGMEKYTSKGLPWKLVGFVEVESRSLSKK